MASIYMEKLAGSAQAERMGIGLFLTEEHTELLKSIMTWKKLKSGTTLFMEGEEAGQLYYIRSGRVKLRKSTEDGKELLLTIQRSGDLIGEFGGVGGEEHNYTAETASACEIGVMQGSELEGLMMRHGELAVQFIKWFGLRQRIMESRFRDLLLYGKSGALASTLIRASNTCGIKHEQGVLLNIKLNHTELGEMIGATRESVNRMLTSFKEQGTIEMKEGKINILQMENLRCMCNCPETGSCPMEICRL